MIKILMGTVTLIFYSERKSIRKSTAAKSAETRKRLRERDEEFKRRKRRSRPHAKEHAEPLTQAQLLKEAEITEEENLKCLGTCCLCVHLLSSYGHVEFVFWNVCEF